MVLLLTHNMLNIRPKSYTVARETGRRAVLPATYPVLYPGMYWAANPGEAPPHVAPSPQRCAILRPAGKRPSSAPTDHLLLVESWDEPFHYLGTQHHTCCWCSKRASSLPLQNEGQCLSHLPLSRIESWGFFNAVPTEFSLATFSPFPSRNFQVLCIPVFWMCVADCRLAFHSGHPRRAQGVGLLFTWLMRIPAQVYCLCTSVSFALSFRLQRWNRIMKALTAWMLYS